MWGFSLLVLLFRGVNCTTLDAVTYGSALKLFSLSEQSSSEKFYLFSLNVQWSTNSGQVVTACKDRASTDSYWQVQSNDISSSTGSPIQCGSVVSFRHLNTGTLLSSNEGKSNLSGQHEVVASKSSDDSVRFVVECVDKDDHWKRTKSIRLRNVTTGKYLISASKYSYNQGNCPNCPIIGDREVSGGEANSREDQWAVDLGVFFKTIKEATEEDDLRDEL